MSKVLSLRQRKEAGEYSKKSWGTGIGDQKVARKINLREQAGL